MSRVSRARAAAVILLFIAAALPAPARAAEKRTVVYAFPVNAGPLDPHAYAPNQIYAQEMLYEPLVTLDAGGDAQPCLAEKWEVDGDGLVYTFILRKGVVFSDGTPFTADAAVKNFRRVLADKPLHGWIGLTEKIVDVRAPDERTLRISLSEPYAATLADLSLPRPYRFLSPGAFAEDGTFLKPVGTGRWKLAETKPGESDLFERNENYWGKAADADAVLVRVIPDAVTRAVALLSGQLDLAFGIGQVPFEFFARVFPESGMTTAVSPPAGTAAAALNTARTPTDDPAVRRALQHAVDKDDLVRGAFLGVQPRADSFFAPGTPFCDVPPEPYAYDPARANALLDEAGWALAPGESVRAKNGAQLEIDFCFSADDSSQKTVAEILRAQAAAAGIRLNLIGEEPAAFERRQHSGDFGMIMTATWGHPFEPHAVLAAMRAPGHADYPAQSGLPSKAKIDAAITRALQTTDDAERRSLYADVLRTLRDEAVYIPLYHPVLLAAYRKDKLDGVRFAPGRYTVPFADFVKKD